jgi:hypothetical protein
MALNTPADWTSLTLRLNAMKRVSISMQISDDVWAEALVISWNSYTSLRIYKIPLIQGFYTLKIVDF